jgi:hypothetical protein
MEKDSCQTSRSMERYLGKTPLPPIMKKPSSNSPIDFFLARLFNLFYQLSTLKMDPP